jgi:hypothetical protein
LQVGFDYTLFDRFLQPSTMLTGTGQTPSLPLALRTCASYRKSHAAPSRNCEFPQAGDIPACRGYAGVAVVSGTWLVSDSGDARPRSSRRETFVHLAIHDIDRKLWRTTSDGSRSRLKAMQIGHGMKLSAILGARQDDVWDTIARKAFEQIS